MSPTSTGIPPVRKTRQVPWAPGEAFARFTAGIADWWPAASHSVGQDKVATVVFEARVGGKLFERWQDGTTSVWGTVRVCEPGQRLVFTWHPGRDAEGAQTVEVTFTARDDGSEVVLVHSGWELLGDEAQANRDGYDSGWTGVLRCYVGGSPDLLATG